MTARQRQMKRLRQNRWVKGQRKVVELEVSLEGSVVRELEGPEWRCLLVKMGREGWPDRLVLLGQGHHCWFEFKRKKFSSLTPAQQRRIPELLRRGERVYLVKEREQAREAVRQERSRV